MASATRSGPSGSELFINAYQVAGAGDAVSVGFVAGESRTVFDNDTTAKLVFACLSARERARVGSTTPPLRLAVRRFYDEVVKPLQLGKKSILDRLGGTEQHRNIFDLSDAPICSDDELQAVLARIGCVPTGINITGQQVTTTELPASWGSACHNMVVFKTRYKVNEWRGGVVAPRSPQIAYRQIRMHPRARPLQRPHRR